MANTIFLEKSYIIASILNVKSKYLRKDFVTIEELNYISNQFQKKLNEENFDAIILDNIDLDYFDVSDVIKINKSQGLSLESVINRYQGYLDLDILLLIWNKETVLNYLTEFILIKSIDKQQNFEILAVPCDRAFVVSPEKTEEFKNQKANLEVEQKIEEIIDKLRINNLVNDGHVLKKTKKQNKK